MTDEHVWVTIGGKPLYVGKRLEAKLPESGSLALAEQMVAKVKRKRRQNPPPAPVEIFDGD